MTYPTTFTELTEYQARILLTLAGSMLPWRKLIEQTGSARELLNVIAEKKPPFAGYTMATWENIQTSVNGAYAKLENELKLIEKNKVVTMMESDSGYPAGLKHISDAPVILYVQGEIMPEDIIAIGIVGTRQPTLYGRAMAEKLAAELAEAGFTTVSGLARGIDGICHATAVKYKSRTIGVLGSGLCKIYPPEHEKLVNKISEKGAIVTEYSMNTTAKPEHFPRRNRIISGMSLGIVVVEADIKSGAIITANHALRQGRDVFAVPGPVHSKQSKGANALIKQGAKLVESVDDIIAEIEWLKPFAKKRKCNGKKAGANVSLNQMELEILNHITREPVNADSIALKAKKSTAMIAHILFNLETKAYIKSLPGRRYVLSEN